MKPGRYVNLHHYPFDSTRCLEVSIDTQKLVTYSVRDEVKWWVSGGQPTQSHLVGSLRSWQMNSGLTNK